MAAKKGIGYSPLSGKVYLGKQNKEKGMWVGEKEDITNDFIGVALSYFEEGTIRTIGNDGENDLFIHIKQEKKNIEKLIKTLEKYLSDEKENA